MFAEFFRGHRDISLDNIIAQNYGYFIPIRKMFRQTKSSGNPAFYLADGRTLFTPYCDTTFNPFNGAAEFNNYINEGTTEAERKGWIDPTLAEMEGKLNGAEGVLFGMPWRTLEQLEPRSS